MAALAASVVLVGTSACGFDGVGTGGLASSASPTDPTAPGGAPGGAPSAGPEKDAPASGPGPDPVQVTGCTDGALSFDGVDDEATAPDHPALDLASDFTVEAWIRPGPKVATGVEMHLVSHHDYEDSRGWVLMLDDGHVELIVYGSEGFSSIGYSAGNAVGPAYVVPGKWAHVAGTLHDGTLRVYYDGVLRDTQELGTFFGRDHYRGSLVFGRAAWSKDFRYEGELDDVRLSSNARYTGPTSPRPAAALPKDDATVALWRFDETTGGALLDASGKGHEGAFVAGPGAPGRIAAACIPFR